MFWYRINADRHNCNLQKHYADSEIRENKPLFKKLAFHTQKKGVTFLIAGSKQNHSIQQVLKKFCLFRNFLRTRSQLFCDDLNKPRKVYMMLLSSRSFIV